MVDTRDLCELFDKRETPRVIAASTSRMAYVAFFLSTWQRKSPFPSILLPPRHKIGPGDVSICQRGNLSALSEKRDVECRKIKETIAGKADGNLEPSLRKEEGAETRHDTPKGPRPTVKE